jgi:CO dehydrogenase maturation factor
LPANGLATILYTKILGPHAFVCEEIVKLATDGKGGVGRATLVSLLAMVYSAEGKRVVAIDANPDTNLASALGIPAEAAREIVPIVELEDLIEERTGAEPGTGSPFSKLKPQS